MSLENVTAGETIVITELDDELRRYKDVLWIVQYKCEVLVIRTDVDQVLIGPDGVQEIMQKGARTCFGKWLLRIIRKLGL